MTWMLSGGGGKDKTPTQTLRNHGIYWQNHPHNIHIVEKELIDL